MPGVICPRCGSNGWEFYQLLRCIVGLSVPPVVVKEEYRCATCGKKATLEIERSLRTEETIEVVIQS